jgi:hypothetical protein
VDFYFIPNINPKKSTKNIANYNSEEDLNTKAPTYIGKQMTIMIPIIIENVKNDYTFVFSINELLKNKFIITNTINRNRRPHPLRLFFILNSPNLPHSTNPFWNSKAFQKIRNIRPHFIWHTT